MCCTLGPSHAPIQETHNQNFFLEFFFFVSLIKKSFYFPPSSETSGNTFVRPRARKEQIRTKLNKNENKKKKQKKKKKHKRTYTRTSRTLPRPRVLGAGLDFMLAMFLCNVRPYTNPPCFSTPSFQHKASSKLQCPPPSSLLRTCAWVVTCPRLHT